MTFPGDSAARIKRVVRKILRQARGLAITHLEQEMGIQPRTYAQKKSLFPTMDAELDKYEKEKAFWITGMVRDDILKVARGYVFNWAKEHPDESVAGAGFEEGLYNLLQEWLPVTDSAGKTINQAARSEVIARTNIMDMYNHARLSMLQTPELKGWVQGYRYSAIIDSATTHICRSLHGKIFTPETLNGYNPPLHYNCRSMLLPVTLLDRGWKAEMAKQGPITVEPQEGFAADVVIPSALQVAATGKANQ